MSFIRFVLLLVVGAFIVTAVGTMISILSGGTLP